MSQLDNVINPERYSQGLTYEAYLGQLGATKQQFIENGADFKLSAADSAEFKKIIRQFGAVKILAIGEDWCPDVQRGLPVVDQIARETGMELRVFPRDKNLDIMNLYLNQGKYMSIPVFAFFDKDLNPLGHWIERSAAAARAIAEIGAELAKQKLSEEEIRQMRRQRSMPLAKGWAQETVKELKELLSNASKNL